MYVVAFLVSLPYASSTAVPTPLPVLGDVWAVAWGCVVWFDVVSDVLRRGFVAWRRLL